LSHIFLVGFMGSGKSTVGRMVADRMKMPFCDLDREIEKRRGRTVQEIFAQDGEPAFRQLEHEELGTLVDAPDTVVACGGGVVIDDRNRALLKQLGTVVYLRVSAEEALARVGSTEGRPLLAGPDPLRTAGALLATRESLYEAAADIVLDTAGLLPARVADLVVEAL
jgi:shikimate kinase